MSQIHVRLTRTPEMESVLSFLQEQYPLLSEAEIIKMVLSEKYQDTVEKTKNIREIIRTPRRQSGLLAMAGVFRGAPDISSNKKKYSYGPQP